MFAFVVNNFLFVMIALAVFLCVLAILHNIAQRRAEKKMEAEKIRKRMFAIEDKARQRREAAERKAANIAKRERAAAAKEAEREKARQVRAANAAARAEVQKARQLEKLEIARQIAEYNERALQAARELRNLDAPPDQSEAPAREPSAPETVQEEATADAAPAERPETISNNDEGPRPFRGQVVSFTGKLSSMKRADAIAAVKAAGGLAFADMPAGTTLLVVGKNPGQTKQDKFDKWIGQVKKITEAQFLAMLKGA